MKQNVKGHDITARYGGEFVIALPNTTLRSAITVADHNHRAVMAKELMKRSSGERLGRVTISIGVALLRTDDTSQSLIERADNRLYAAKRQWRDRVICETDPEAELRGGPEAAPPARVRSHHCEIARATTLRWPARAGPIRRSRTPRSGSDC
jgi:diguanylate cyclase